MHSPVVRGQGLMVIVQSVTQDSFLPYYCEAFLPRCTTTSLMGSIKGVTHLKS